MIRKIILSTNIVSTFAGSGTAAFLDATGTTASFNGPWGITADPSGNNLYVADSNNNRIRKIAILTASVSTVARSSTGSLINGIGTAATLKFPTGITFDSTGSNLYVADTHNHVIRKIIIASTTVSTVAGSGTGSFADATGISASFKNPYAVAIDSTSTNLYVADSSNNRIRKIILSSTSDVGVNASW